MTPDELAALTHRPEPGPHRTTITVDGRAVETLADLPPRRDGLLFIGLNPSPVSVELPPGSGTEGEVHTSIA